MDLRKTKDKHEIRTVPPQEVRLLFPRNYLHAEIVADRVEIHASVDIHGIDELIERLGILRSLIARGLLPQAPTQGIEASGEDADAASSRSDESPVGVADAPETPALTTQEKPS